MTQDSKKNINILSFTYSFTPQETEILAHFMRKHQDEIPAGLTNFSKTIEDKVYNAMSIDEAEKFYS
ncbi:MAG: hypothetical protein M0P01_02165 [Treponema sp.]|nr:hypothetical protein [Treponema sp.]